MRKFIMSAAALAVAVTAVPLIAQAPSGPPGKPDAALVTGGSYAVEGNHTQVLFSYDHFGFTQNAGLISGGTGTLVLDPKAPNAATISIEMPISTIRTTIAKLDEEFQGAKFFDAAKFPTAKFESTGVTVSGETAKIAGNLTIKGVTKPVTLDASFRGAGVNPFNKKETIGFAAQAKIKRSDYGLGAAIPLVGDDVTLTIAAAFEKQ